MVFLIVNYLNYFYKMLFWLLFMIEFANRSTLLSHLGNVVELYKDSGEIFYGILGEDEESFYLEMKDEENVCVDREID